MDTSNLSNDCSDVIEDKQLKGWTCSYPDCSKDGLNGKEEVDVNKIVERILEHKRNANLLFIRKKFNESIVQFKKCLELLNLISFHELKKTNLDEIRIECLINISVTFFCIKDYWNCIKFTDKVIGIRSDFKCYLLRYKSYLNLSLYTEAIEAIKSAMEMKKSKELLLELENTQFKYNEARQSQEKTKLVLKFVFSLNSFTNSTPYVTKIIYILFFILINFFKKNKFLFTFLSVTGTVTLIHQISKKLQEVLNVKF